MTIRPDFPKKEVAALAARCTFPDEEFFKIGQRCRAAGYYTKDDLLVMCKAAGGAYRSCRLISTERIQWRTATSISTESERERISSLRSISGVSWYTASFILHFTFEGKYPILSRQALWAWGYDTRPVMAFPLWWAYVRACRALSAECGATMRDLDRALRQFATEESVM